MSSFILSKSNFKYLKEEIIKYMMSEDGSYLIFKLDYFKQFNSGFSNIAFRNFEKISEYVNNEVNYLQEINVKSFNEQYKENEKIDYAADVKQKQYYYERLSEEKLLQIFRILNCLNYQIEIEYNNEFLNGVKNHIACTIADRRIDKLNASGCDIKWKIK